MKQENFSALGTEELKQKYRIHSTLFMVFLGVYLLLVGMIVYQLLTDGMTALTAVPIALMPILIINRKKLKAMQTEIKSRAN